MKISYGREVEADLDAYIQMGEDAVAMVDSSLSGAVAVNVFPACKYLRRLILL